MACRLNQTRPVWDALDRHVQQRVPVPVRIQQPHTAVTEEWTNPHRQTVHPSLSIPVYPEQGPSEVERIPSDTESEDETTKFTTGLD